MSDAFETVHRTSDRLEAEMVCEVLVREGLDARLIGTTNTALIGVAPHIVKLRIEVPAESAAQAREIIAGLQSAEAAGPEAAAAAEAEAEAETVAVAEPPAATAAAAAPGSPAVAVEPEAPRRRHPLLGAGAAFVLPGGCHIYARHPFSALVLALGYVAAFIVMVGARRHAVAASGALTLGGLLLADALGGQLAIRRANLQLRPGRARQLARGLVLVCVAALLGTVVGTTVPPPKPKAPVHYGPRIEYGPREPRDLPLDLPFLTPEMEQLLQRRGAASQPASAPLVWPRPRPSDPRPPSPQIPR